MERFRVNGVGRTARKTIFKEIGMVAYQNQIDKGRERVTDGN